MPFLLLEQGVSLKELADYISCELRGKATQRVYRIAPFDHAGANDLSFYSKDQGLDRISNSQIGCLIISPKAFCKIDPSKLNDLNLIISSDPLASIVKLVPLFFKPHSLAAGINSNAQIDPSATIGQNCKIGAFSVISAEVKLGKNVVIHPHVVIYPNVEIGDNCLIHSGAIIREDCKIGAGSIIQNGAIIGADGFGYIADATEGLKAVPQIGNVILDPKVEVGANSCLDRATFGSTTIGTATKIDNLVQIGHNVSIGKFSIVCGQVGIAGSCQIGNQVVLGGGAGLADHVKIEDGIRVAARAGVTNDLSEKGDYAGFPAQPAAHWRRGIAFISRQLKKSKK